MEGLDNLPVWYKIYTKGEYKWIRIEGRGMLPQECEDIIIRMSPGNTDTLIDEETCQDVDGKIIRYDDYPGNMYIQSEKLRQLINMGYEENEDNFTPLIE